MQAILDSWDKTDLNAKALFLDVIVVAVYHDLLVGELPPLDHGQWMGKKVGRQGAGMCAPHYNKQQTATTSC
jgi:hypothetical protein